MCLDHKKKKESGKKKEVLKQTLIYIRTHPMIKEASDTGGKVIDYSVNGARNLTVL